MPTVYQIGVNLSTDATGFERGMLKAASAVHKFSLDFHAIGNIAAGMSLGHLVESGISGFKELIHGQAEAIDSNLKLAAVVGVTTRSLVGMQHAGDLAGVGQEELGANLIRLQKNIGEAARGGGELVDKLDEMGLNAQELAAMPLDQALQKVANAIGNVENRAIRTSMAMDLFGKKGAKMVTILAEGSAGLDKATREAEALGLVVNDNVAKGVEAMNDQFTRTKALAKGAANGVVSFFAPFIDSASDAILSLFGVNDAMEQIQETMDQGKSLADQSFTVHVGPATIETNAYSESLDKLEKLMTSLETPTERLTKQMDDLQLAFSFGHISGEEFEELTSRLVAQIPKTEDPLATMINQLEEQAAAIGKSDRNLALDKAMNLGATAAELTIIADLFDQIDEATKDAELNAGLDTFAKNITESTKTPLEKYIEQVDKLHDALDQGKITQTVFDRAMVQADELLDKSKVIGAQMESVRGEVSLGAAAGSQQAAGRIDAFRRSGAGAEKTLQDQLKELRDLNKNQRDLPKAFAAELRGVIGAAEF